MSEFLKHVICNHVVDTYRTMLSASSKDMVSALLYAVEHEFDDILRCLLSVTIYLNARDQDSNTLLMLAVEKNSFKIASILLEHGVNIDETNHYNGNTALIVAVRNKHIDMVKYLVERGANMDIKSEVQEYTAIMLAVHHEDVVMTEYLIQSGALFINVINRFHESALSIAVQTNNDKMVELLLKHGSGENMTVCSYTLSYIVCRKNASMLRLLLDYHVNPNIPAQVWPLLITIVKLKWIEGLEIILDKKYDLIIDQAVLGNETALYNAITNLQEEMVRMLLCAGANPNSHFHGISLLSCSCAQPNTLGITKLLIEHGADVNGCHYNETVLMTCIKSGNIQCIKLLLRSGAKIHDLFELEECNYHIRNDHTRSVTKQLLEDVTLSTMTSPYMLEINIQCIQTLDYDIWYNLLSKPSKYELNKLIKSRNKDERACYTALYEGEDVVLKKFRQGEHVDFSQAKIRGIVRPMGMRHIRKLLSSYLIYPLLFRSILSRFEPIV